MAAAELRIICGPTAAGKSALALSLAERGPTTIISADSRQIYRRFDIGTAKPTAGERRRVPHRGIDIVDPTERHSAAAWAEDAIRWAAEATAAQRTAVVVGGTGFYLRALAMPLFEEPPLDADRRAALARALNPMTTPELRRWCEQLDPARAHLGRTQLLRAIEIAILTGRPISAWHREQPRRPTVRARWLVVSPRSPAALAHRIEERAAAMVRAGWEDEVRELVQTVPEDAPAWNATGYRTVRERVRGTLTRDAMLARIIVETRQYAKRQRTWFRHQLPSERVTRIDPGDERAMDMAIHWWREGATQ
ncbi:MAG TPA: tRNA (adenosine(37)-N6)-dimethylallyltransferase MiaA [Gemmatimonadaceae bacterium]|nr:tRNA (adenosine(37)-N6)-dimethylallyltransferase MiaA [Gemmatimonadaceae bacterium]